MTTTRKKKNNKFTVLNTYNKVERRDFSRRYFIFALTFTSDSSKIVLSRIHLKAMYAMPKNNTFINLKDSSHFDIKMQYPILGMKNAVNECFVRYEVFEMLNKAQKSLPSGYRLRIWDAWRPLALQKELYEVYRQSIIDTFKLTSLPDTEKDAFISKYIAIPSENPDIPPAHTTGGAVDLTLIDESGNEHDMGTGFDDFSEKAATDYFEKKEFGGSIIQKNRRILKSSMESAGFTNLSSEWWHYDYGDENWAKAKGLKALYKGIFSQNEMNFN